MKPNPKLFHALLESEGLPIPEAEFQFAHPRRWRFDWAWPEQKLALECQGGTWTGGRHVRGAALLKEWEKLNSAAVLGWRLLYCQPSDLIKTNTMQLIKRALGLSQMPCQARD